ncbi:Ig-like domain-containing protein [Demequina litorisediminis]|uniref:Bacterial Ig-like domain-containing protein n=1 Tax=Demequina litorisediminis TaxID=1849022 RepID=A0ABQ6IG32_9MICO|nr:Ig-like domain-containing protein [Demequina litorisediminis]GMA36709.1 hypothetical protein GCM10025876_29130 [Demequina litorisediminis]
MLDASGAGENLVVNPGFEDGKSPWETTGSGITIPSTSDVITGSYTAHFYKATDYTFTVSQTLTDVPAGDYRLSATVHGVANGDADSAYTTVASGIASNSADLSLDGWQNYDTATTDVISIVEGADVQVQATFKLTAGSWGAIDDFQLVAENPMPVADTAALESLLDEAAAYSADDYSVASYAALTRAVARGEWALGASAPSQATVDNAAEALQSAIDGLVPGDGTIPDPTVEPVAITVVDGEDIVLPSTVTVTSYDETTTTESVTWNDSVSWIDGPGVYTVTGTTANGWTATATITVTESALLLNGGFENGFEDVSPWDITASPWPDAAAGTFWVSGDDKRSGDYSLNFWNGTGAEFSGAATQNVTGLEPGAYTLSAWLTGGETADVTLTATTSEGFEATTWCCPAGATGPSTPPPRWSATTACSLLRSAGRSRTALGATSMTSP